MLRQRRQTACRSRGPTPRIERAGRGRPARESEPAGRGCPAQSPNAVNRPVVETVIVTARRREEDPQRVPISLSVIPMETLERTRTYNINQLTLLQPSVNYTSPNPRNTALTIRGLGSSVVAIAQANDGLEPGVGFYVDQVYHGRPATAAFDFVDVERVEVLRGPQGTLFGKNTTAGAISITTREPDVPARDPRRGFRGITSGTSRAGPRFPDLSSTTSWRGARRWPTRGGTALSTTSPRAWTTTTSRPLQAALRSSFG